MRRIKAFGAWIVRHWSGLCAASYVVWVLLPQSEGERAAFVGLALWAGCCWNAEREARKAKANLMGAKLAAAAWEDIALTLDAQLDHAHTELDRTRCASSVQAAPAAAERFH